MDGLKKHFSKYLLYEMSTIIGDHSSAIAETQVYRFENDFGVAILFLMDITDGGSYLVSFSFNLLKPDGSVLKKISSEELANKIQKRYNTYYFYNNDRLIDAVIDLIKEAREYLLTCNSNTNV